jgi:hypothetical protein
MEVGMWILKTIVRSVSPEPRRHVHCGTIKGDYKEAEKVT